jgi:hypothetical protein
MADLLAGRKLYLSFILKFYPPSEIHKDRNQIYNFWPHDGESIAQACNIPNFELNLKILKHMKS